MVNWIVYVKKPSKLDKSTFLVPKHCIASLIAKLLEDADWCEGDSITVEPSNMEYFDG